MDQTAKVAKTLSETARMGISAIDMLLTKVENDQMREELLREKRGYEKCDRKAEEIMQDYGVKAKAPGPMQRAGTWMGIQMDTLTDRTPSHIADMLIQGSSMGIVEMTRAKNENPEAEKRALDLADEYLTGEKDSIERLKAFL